MVSARKPAARPRSPVLLRSPTRKAGLQSSILPILSRMVIFEDLAPRDRREIAKLLKDVKLSPGEYVFHANDPATAVYFIADGELDVLTHSASAEYRVNQLGPGDFFGEIALLDLEPRSASVRARTKARVLELSASDFYDLFRRYPRSTRVILHRLSSRMRKMTVELQNQLTALAASNERLEHSYDATLAALSVALDLRDHETEGHSERVTKLAERLGELAGVDGLARISLRHASLLHDIGKIGVPDAILRKPGPLTDDEWVIMKNHPEWGCRMLAGIDFLKDALRIIRHHHERYAGTGYPDGLCGEAIPLGSRIFAIVDAHDAMTNCRPYRRGLSRKSALAELKRCSGTHFDPQLVKTFISLVVAG